MNIRASKFFTLTSDAPPKTKILINLYNMNFQLFKKSDPLYNLLTIGGLLVLLQVFVFPTQFWLSYIAAGISVVAIVSKLLKTGEERARTIRILIWVTLIALLSLFYLYYKGALGF